MSIIYLSLINIIIHEMSLLTFVFNSLKIYNILLLVKKSKINIKLKTTLKIF